MDILIVLLSLGTALGAAEPAAEKPGIVVLPLRAESASDKTRAGILDEMLVAEVERYDRYRVLAMSDVKALLGFDKTAEALGCDDASCAAQIGGALGVRYIIAGSISSIEGDIVLAIKMLDTQAALVVDRATADVPNNPRNFPDLIRRAVSQMKAIVFVAPGTLSITTEPAGATLIVDGKDAGVAPKTLSVPPGVHTVAARSSGYTPVEKPVTVQGGATATVTLTLARIEPPRIRVVSDPPGARVSVGGQLKGTTPLDSSPLTVEVPEGSYTVIASLEGYMSAQQTVRATAGEINTVTLRLMAPPPASTSSYRSLTIASFSGMAAALAFGGFSAFKGKDAGDAVKAGDLARADESRKWAGIMWASGGVGVALAGLGVFALTRPASGAGVTLTPVVGQSGLAVAGGW